MTRTARPDVRDIWRQAALDDTRQTFVYPGGPFYSRPVKHLDDPSFCAAQLLDHAGQGDWLSVSYFGPCPVEGCSWVLRRGRRMRMIIHLNDAHRWTWLDFANKLPADLLGAREKSSSNSQAVRRRVTRK